MDILHKFLKWVSYNRWKVVGIIFLLSFSTWLVSCEPTTASPLTGMKVGASQFEVDAIQVSTDLQVQKTELDQMIAAYNIEADALVEKVDYGRDDLTKQYELRQQLIDTAGALGSAAVAGTLNPAAAIGTIVTVGSLLFGAGAYADKRRTDRVLANLKNPTPNTLNT